MPTYDWQNISFVTLSSESLTDEKKKTLAESITTNFNAWKQARLGIEQCWKQIDRQVNQYDPFYSPSENNTFGVRGPSGIGEARSRIKTPNTYAHREGLTATLIQNQFKNDLDFFDPVPLDDAEEELANDFKAYLTYTLDLMALPKDVELFTRTLIHYGTSIASVQWVRESYPRWQTLEIPSEDEPGSFKTVQQAADSLVYNAPKISICDPYYTVLDPSNPNMKTSTLIMKKAMTAHDIMANTAYEGLDFEWLKTQAPLFSGNKHIQDEQELSSVRRENMNQTEKYGDKIEVYEAWGDFYDGYRVYKNYVAEVIGDKLIRFTPNPTMLPHKPFVIARTSVEANFVYGTSVLYPIVGLQATMDTVLNQHIDSNTINLNRPWELDSTATILGRNKAGAPVAPVINMHSVILTNGAPALKRADIGNFNPDTTSVNLIGLIQTMMERATGDTELMSGGAPSEYMKTGVAIQSVNAGTTRLNLYAKTLENAVEDILIIVCDLLRQNASSETAPITYKKVDGTRSTITVDPAVLASDFRFTLRGAAYNIARQSQTANLTQFFTLAGQNPVLAQVMNWIEVARTMLEQMEVRNIARLFLPQANQQAAMLQAQQPTFLERMGGFFNASQAKKQREDNIGQTAGGSAPPNNIEGQQGQPSPFGG